MGTLAPGALVDPPVTALAQIPGFPKSTAPKQSKEETPEQTKARLQDWQKEARGALARLEEPTVEAQLPEGISPAALADRRRDLDQTVRTITRTISLLDELPKARQAAKAAETAAADWNGFEEKPPYSILKLDDLLNQRAALKEREATYRSSQTIFNKSFDGIDEETHAVENTMRLALDATGKADANEAAKWRMEAARVKSRLLSVRAFFVRSNIELIEAQLGGSSTQLALLEKQIAIVQKKVVFSDEDLATIKKASDDRLASLKNEIKQIQQRLKDASSARTRAKAIFDDLTAADPPTPQPDLALAATRLSAAETRLETLQFIADSLESFESLEDFIPVAYENRKTLMESKNPADRDAALESLRSLLNRLDAWEVVTANAVAATNADLTAQDSNTSVIPADDPRLPALADQRKATWEKLGFLQRIAQTIISHRKNVERWLSDFEVTNGKKGWHTEFSRGGDAILNVIKKVWFFEVTKVETVDYSAGVARTTTRVITLGIVITALTLFLIAYLVSAKISRRLQGVIVGRGHIAEAQANTLRTWLMILVSIALAVTTLKYFDIPLTVFAFFGGALAIGLGFGTQTLIKNFISGIIMLFERKIRVGDVIEIDTNTSGTVVEINTRSSVLRNAEGKETLIPNSLFLENRVTNLTLSNRRVRRVIRLGVAHGSETSQVMTILKECAERHGLILKEPAPIVTLDDITACGPIFAIFFWVEFNSKTDSTVVSSDMRIMIDKRFAETGIQFQNSDMNLRTEAPLRFAMALPDHDSDEGPPKRSIP
jgi:small-conductance mechanosensitive channel